MYRLLPSRTIAVLLSVIVPMAVAGIFFFSRGGSVADNTPDPYAYKVAEEELSEETRQLAGMIEGAQAKIYDLTVPETDLALARAEVIELPGGRDLIVGWQSRVTEPVLRSDIKPSEEIALITALKSHLPEDAVVLAMPDLSDRLSQFAPSHYPLAAMAGQQAYRAPAGTEDTVLRMEKRWLGERSETEQPELFRDFIDAMVAEDAYGLARLQVMAGGSEAYIALHVRDSFDVGITAPDKILVGLKDFPGGTHAHDVTRQVKTWIADQDYAAYTVSQIGDETIRSYFLADAKDKATLLGQLLPFNTARVGLVPGAKLVFQTGGYWVYRIDPVAATN